MVDTHAHIFSDEFNEDIGEVIHNASAEKVEYIIMPAIESKTFEKMYNLTVQYPNLFCTIGIHPHNSNEFSQHIISQIEEYAIRPKVKAIGEIGLDYYYDFSPKEIQKKVFIQQIELAKKFDLPIIVHNREADNDVFEILKEQQDGLLKGVLHCFSSDIKMMEKIIELGFNVSFTGNITFKKADALREVVKQTPIDKIMLETDSPYMAPVPFRGKRNEPKYLKYIAEKISEIKSINLEEVIQMTTKTAKAFFRLSMFVLFVGLLFAFTNLYAQQNDEDTTNIQPKNGYINKILGIGFVLGTNTVVDTYKPSDQDVSHDGLFTYGGNIIYHPLSWTFIQASYLHFEDKKPAIDAPGILDPIKSNLYETAIGFIANPYSRVNFFALTGISYTNRTSSSYNFLTQKKTILIDNKYGMLFGLGFFANIPISGAGLFVLSAEWRLNFVSGSTKLNYDPRYNYTDTENYNKPSEFTSFFSIPRFGIIWYPPLF
jgi:TatD DNase family protein